MILSLALAGAVLLALVLRRYMMPSCPRCRSKQWDRRLCQPLLFCRRCATRIDTEGRVYN